MYLMNNAKTVYTLSGSKPLYVYSATDKYILEVARSQESEQSKSSGIVNAFKNVVGAKFDTHRIADEQSMQEIAQSPESIVVNLDYCERCLIAGKDEDQKLDGGLVIGTYPNSDGKYYGPTEDGLPNVAVGLFQKLYGETDVEAIREELTQEGGQDLLTQELPQTEMSVNYGGFPVFTNNQEPDLEQ